MNHKRLLQDWKQISVYLQVIHSLSHYTTSLLFSNHNSNSVHNFGTRTKKNINTYFWAYLYSVGTQHGNLHPAGWSILFFGPTQEPVLAIASTGKNRKMFWTKCRWMDRKGRNWRGRNPWNVWLYNDLLLPLKEEPLSSVLLTDGTLISASAAPHCWEADHKCFGSSGFFLACQVFWGRFDESVPTCTFFLNVISVRAH